MSKILELGEHCKCRCKFTDPAVHFLHYSPIYKKNLALKVSTATNIQASFLGMMPLKGTKPWQYKNVMRS